MRGLSRLIILFPIVVLAFVSISKWLDFIYSGRLLFDSQTATACIICIEFGFAVWLLTDYKPALCKFFVATLFFIFMAYGLFFQDWSSPCGCLGRIRVPNWLPPLLSAVCISCLWFENPTKPLAPTGNLSALGFALFTAVCSLVIHDLSSKDTQRDLAMISQLAISSQERTSSEPLLLLDLFGERPYRKGNWSFLVVREGCQKCDQLIDKFVNRPTELESLNVVLVAIGSIRNSVDLAESFRFVEFVDAPLFSNVQTPLLVGTADGQFAVVDSEKLATRFSILNNTATSVR